MDLLDDAAAASAWRLNADPRRTQKRGSASKPLAFKRQVEVAALLEGT